jgi:predicted transcriptional regulator
MKKIPVNTRVLRVVEAKMPLGATVKDIAKITGMPNQSVSNCLWKLKSQGKIERDSGFYKLTSVNKSTEVVETTSPTLENNNEKETLTIGKVARALAKENERLKLEVAKWEKEWRYAREGCLDFERKYFDALAVIKYLEAK